MRRRLGKRMTVSPSKEAFLLRLERTTLNVIRREAQSRDISVTDMFKEIVGDLPLTGFFCNGEIGPVRGTTFLHGYTSSFGIFRPKDGQTQIISPKD